MKEENKPAMSNDSSDSQGVRINSIAIDFRPEFQEWIHALSGEGAIERLECVWNEF